MNLVALLVVSCAYSTAIVNIAIEYARQESRASWVWGSLFVGVVAGVFA